MCLRISGDEPVLRPIFYMNAALIAASSLKTEGPMDRLTTTEADEPVGIIISTGSHPEPAPRFAAYVWGPVPDEPEPVTSGEPRAA